MAIRVVRFGEPRARGEGVRIGTVRLLPRGVKKEDYARRNFFDLWLPEVAPTRGLVAYAQAKPWTDARWAAYRKKYLREMQRPEAQRVIALLAAFGRQANFSIGCYCENPWRCHRSLLGELLRERGAKVSIPRFTTPRSASPRRSR
ncbi:MAG TPA: DUF488 family protein [Vicinamibacterales bacterium]|jgi:uncharacterized protein YeaO (DUF488 family)|nr:DUF488 family protein [Vicinamibacterales bacterium]